MTELLLIAVVVVGLAGTLVGEGRKLRWMVWTFKPLASTAFIALAGFCGALDSTYGALILAGLVLSWFGDVFLISRKLLHFRLGLVSFLLGHVAYVIAFVSVGLDGMLTGMAAIPLSVTAVVVFLWLRPNLGRMKVPVLAYVVVITVMVICAVGTVHTPGGAVRVLGAMAFYLSDLGVARDRFVAEGLANRLFGLPLYYGGQVLLALSIALTLP